MALWKRSKKEDKQGGGSSPSAAGSQGGPTPGASISSAGLVSSVLSGPAGASEQTPFGDVVARRFGPGNSQGEAGSRLPPQYSTVAGAAGDGTGAGDREDVGPPSAEAKAGQAEARDSQQIGRDPRDRLRAVAPLFSDQPATPELEVDLMAHIGRETTITGDVVAEEDLEIQGTIEGSVRLPNHQVTVGNEGHVKASVDAHTVIVFGKITGDVVASELVEVEKGGIVGGDIKSPRVIMHDGAIVIGGLDMSASLPNPAEEPQRIKKPEPNEGFQSARPKLEWVESEASSKANATAQAEPEAAESGDGSTV